MSAYSKLFSLVAVAVVVARQLDSGVYVFEVDYCY
jgi:hypothetical protein